MQKDINDMTKGVEFYPIRHSGLDRGWNDEMLINNFGLPLKG
jgi:hypothetical protein